VQSEPGAGDCGGPRPAVGLDDVAVDRDRRLAERPEVGHRAQAAPDEPLDLVGASARAAGADLAALALVRGGRQHRVLGRHPTLALAP